MKDKVAELHGVATVKTVIFSRSLWKPQIWTWYYYDWFFCRFFIGVVSRVLYCLMDSVLVWYENDWKRRSDIVVGSKPRGTEKNHRRPHSRSITVAARSKAWTVFARSNIDIVGSNPTGGMDVCVRLFCLCCPVWRKRPCNGMILRPMSPTDCV
jgi:hypothetical protein